MWTLRITCVLLSAVSSVTEASSSLMTFWNPGSKIDSYRSLKSASACAVARILAPLSLCSSLRLVNASSGSTGTSSALGDSHVASRMVGPRRGDTANRCGSIICTHNTQKATIAELFHSGPTVCPDASAVPPSCLPSPGDIPAPPRGGTGGPVGSPRRRKQACPSSP